MTTRSLVLCVLVAACGGQATATCEEAGEGSCGAEVAEAVTDERVATLPASGEWIADPYGLLSTEVTKQLNVNLTQHNKTTPFRIYLALVPQVPASSESRTPRDFAKRLLRDWLSSDRRVYDQTLLAVIITGVQRIEIVTGSKARRRLKESSTRRIARRAMQALKNEGGMEGVDVAATIVVRKATEQLKKDKGVIGSLRGVMMPLMIGVVLLFMYMKNQNRGSTASGMGMGMGSGGGMGGMGGMDGMDGMGMDGMGMGMDGGMGGGFGGGFGGGGDMDDLGMDESLAFDETDVSRRAGSAPMPESTGSAARQDLRSTSGRRCAGSVTETLRARAAARSAKGRPGDD